MKPSSRLRPGLLDPMIYIFSFLMIYLTILASPQQPTQPNNDLRVSHVSVVDSLQVGRTSILITLGADYQGEAISIDCEIVFPSLVGPPDRYVSAISSILSSLFRFCGYTSARMSTLVTLFSFIVISSLERYGNASLSNPLMQTNFLSC